MIHEAARHIVSRLWLYAFAGIVAAACAAPYARASGPVAAADENATGAFSQFVSGRNPIRAFVTDLGVYELDKDIKCVRIWQRGGDGTELQRPPNSDAFVPYTQTQLEAARQSHASPFRFSGVVTEGGRFPEDDSGIVFKMPVGLDKHPTENKFAVVSGGEYIDQGLNRYCPSIQVYGFEETAGEDGNLASVVLSFEGSFENAFYATTNGWEQVIDRIWQYPDVLVTTNYYSDGTIRSVTTNTFVEYETTLLDRQFSTNWVYVASTNDGTSVTLDTNTYSRTGLDEPVWWNPLYTDLLVPGFEYTIVITNDWVSVSTNYYSLTNWVFRPYGITTNSSYLATATDVAFLGDEGLVASISAEDYQAVRSGFLVFGTDPAAPAKLLPVDGLDKAIQGIAVDKETGDIYAAVPDMAAVFRFPPPNATSDGVGGSPGGWLEPDDRTPVFHDDFVAGVTNASGSTRGRLSSPADVAVWYPEEAPFLLVADAGNNRVQMFDPNSLSWAETNWLGTNPPRRPSSPDGLLPVFFEEFGAPIPLDPETGLPFDPDILAFVETNETDIVTNYYHALPYYPYVTTNGNGVVTNYYRLETTAFPVFSTEGCDGLSADPPKGPKGAWGQDGTTSFVLADTGKRRVRVLGIDDLSAIDSDEILAMAVWWPSVGGSAPGLAARDMAVVGDTLYWDALVPDAAEERVHVVREHETYENELHFTVSPARHDRTYTLSVAGGAGVVEPVQATATVPAGATEGVFTFKARDGIVSTEFLLSWRDQYGNQVPEGDPTAVRSVTQRVSASPAYTLAVSSDGDFSTNALLAVANVDPIVTNAQVIGYVVYALEPYVQALGLRVEATDASGSDDASLAYLWWASTNVNWAINHRDWAVTNHDWASSASANWSEGPSFPAEQYTTASVITGTETGGLVSNTVSLMVARGREVRLPPYTIGRTNIGVEGYPINSEPGNTPFYVVCTVLDKDGGHTIVSFPTPPEPSGYAGIWDGVYDRAVSPEDSPSSTASYQAQFTAVSGTGVSFAVTLAPGSGDPQSTDTVRLEAATNLANPDWSSLGDFSVGSAFLSVPEACRSSAAVTNSVPTDGSDEVRFYRVVRP